MLGLGPGWLGRRDHSWGGVAQGSGCWSAGLEVFQHCNQECRCAGIYPGGISAVLISLPLLGSLAASSKCATSPAISRKQLVPGVEVTALLSRDNESPWDQAVPVVLGFLRKLTPGLYSVSPEDMDSAAISDSSNKSSFTKSMFSPHFTVCAGFSWLGLIRWPQGCVSSYEGPRLFPSCCCSIILRRCPCLCCPRWTTREWEGEEQERRAQLCHLGANP